MGRRGEGHRAVTVVGGGVVVWVGTGRDVDDILRANVANDEVVSTVGEEVDAVSGFEGRDVDSVVVFRTLDGDGVEGQAGGIEVTDRKHGVVAGPGVDGDLFNASQLGNHGGVVGAVAGDDDLGAGI